MACGTRTTLPQIPVAGITAEDADKLQRMQDRKQRVVVRMKLGAQTLPDVESANVIAELRGRKGLTKWS